MSLNPWCLQAAMKVIGFQTADIDGIYRLVAGILHLGNVNFGSGETDAAYVTNRAGACGGRRVCSPRPRRGLTVCALVRRPMMLRPREGGQVLWVQRGDAREGADLPNGQGLVQVRQGRGDAAHAGPGDVLARRARQVDLRPSLLVHCQEDQRKHLLQGPVQARRHRRARHLRL